MVVAAATLHAANYADFPAILAQLGLPAVDHLLLDVGVNSAQVEDAGRGFSFDRDGPLDMRYDRSGGPTAADLVNGLSERELSDLFYFNAQEPASRKIAMAAEKMAYPTGASPALAPSTCLR